MTFTHPAICMPGAARRVNSISVLDLHLDAASTDGSMGLFETVVAANDGPPLHIHSREDEMFYVLAGTFSFTCGEESFVAGPGASMLLPRNVPHTYRNVGGTEGRLLVAVTPGGFENFFVDVEREGATEPAEIVAIGARYGLTFLPPKAEAA